MKLGSGPIGLFYRGQIRAQKADITTGIGNGDTEDEAGDRETSDEEKSRSEEENNSDEKSKSEEENKSEQEAPTSSHVHTTAGKIDASIKEIGNEAIKLNQENMEDEAHNHELSDGFKSPESQTKATYANHVRKSRQKKECTNPKENNRYDASTPHTHLHLQKPINEEERRASRERPKQNAKSARSRLRRGPRS